MSILKSSFFKRAGKGQSTVEYLVIVGAIITMFLSGTGVIKELSTAIKYKHKGYTFAVAIPDPPSVEIDRSQQKATEKIDEAKEIIDQIIDFVSNPGEMLPTIGKNIKGWFDSLF